MDESRDLAAFDARSQETRLDASRLLVWRGAEGALFCEIGAVGVRQKTMPANLAVLPGIPTEDCCVGRPQVCRPLIEESACAI